MNDNIFTLLSQMLFAVFGACARWVHNYTQNRSIAALCCDIFVAAFLGLMIHYAIKSAGLPSEVASASASVAGWKGMKYFETYIDRVVEALMQRFFPEEK